MTRRPQTLLFNNSVNSSGDLGLALSALHGILRPPYRNHATQCNSVRPFSIVRQVFFPIPLNNENWRYCSFPLLRVRACDVLFEAETASKGVSVQACCTILGARGQAHILLSTDISFLFPSFKSRYPYHLTFGRDDAAPFVKEGDYKVVLSVLEHSFVAVSVKVCMQLLTNRYVDRNDMSGRERV